MEHPIWLAFAILNLFAYVGWVFTYLKYRDYRNYAASLEVHNKELERDCGVLHGKYYKAKRLLEESR